MLLWPSLYIIISSVVSLYILIFKCIFYYIFHIYIYICFLHFFILNIHFYFLYFILILYIFIFTPILTTVLIFPGFCIFCTIHHYHSFTLFIFTTFQPYIDFHFTFFTPRTFFFSFFPTFHSIIPTPASPHEWLPMILLDTPHTHRISSPWISSRGWSKMPWGAWPGGRHSENTVWIKVDVTHSHQL